MTASDRLKVHFVWTAWERLHRLNYNIPPLGVLRVAGQTPADVEVRFTDEMVSPVDLQTDADIIALSSLTPSAPHAYELAAAFRERGKYVVLGGAHASIAPEDAARHVDTVFVGEAEGLWATFLEDFRRGRPERLYRRPDLPSLAGLPPTRRDLLATRVYPYENPVEHGIESIELSRGCTSRCAYCLVPRIQGDSFRNRPLDEIDREFASVADTDGIIFFTDNNLLGNWSHTRQALELLKRHGKDWFGLLAPEDTARDPEVLELLLQSGLCGVYGTVKAISGKEDAQELRRRITALKRLGDGGVVIIATFALGWDDHPPEVFSRTVEFCVEAGLDVPEFIINTPFPGSRLHQRYAEEGRLLTHDWAMYNGNHCVYRPKLMSAEALEAGYRWCYEELYRDVDRDKALYDAFRDLVLCAMIRSRRRRREREQDDSAGLGEGPARRR